MKIKKNAFSTLVLEFFCQYKFSCRKLKIQKNPKFDFHYYTCLDVFKFRFESLSVIANQLKTKHTVQYTTVYCTVPYTVQNK
jgi:hypothetical protein